MNTSRMRGSLGAAAAIAAIMLLPVAGYAADLSGPDSLKDTPDLTGDVSHGGNVHSTIPAGVTGAAMVGQGEGMLMYMPMYMSMDGNYIGTEKISTNTILSLPTHTPMPGAMQTMYLRMVPNSMDAQMHMLGAMYGVTDAFNVMIMGGYTDKEMTMTTYSNPMSPNPATAAIKGTRTYSTDGISDTSVTGLYRLYDDGINHIHLNLGLSLPTANITQQINMLSPGGTYMLMRGTYGMQIGTGTVDFLPGLTYTGNKGLWSWGAAYRGRFALDNNDEGYHWGDSNQLTGWLGYTIVPGVTATARIAGTVQGKIEGQDPNIFGLMQGANPAYYGGETVDVFGGIEIAGQEFGLGSMRLAIEAGAPLYQNLNGPQVGQDWQLNAVLATRF
ncbi:MAG: hypothetical protein ACLPPF_09070 [Rhodomicrobium sp.]